MIPKKIDQEPPMPKKPKASGSAGGHDLSRLNQIDVYTYPEYDRANIPPVDIAKFDTVASHETKYEYDPHIDPSLQWAGKKEGTSFEVPTTSIHIHESIKPHKIIRSVQSFGEDFGNPYGQGYLFESDAERAKRRNDSIEFYQHKDKWTNRLIAGDSMIDEHIYDGDIAIFHPGLKEGSGIYVVSVGSTLVVKRVDFDTVNQTIILISANPDYPPRPFSGHDLQDLMGRVLSCVHRV